MKAISALYLALALAAEVAGLVNIGPFGSNWDQLSFDDRDKIPTQPYHHMHMSCRSGNRLDYLGLSYLDENNGRIAIVEHGNVKAGNNFHQYTFGSTDDITEMNVYVCNGKYKGQICGIFVKFRAPYDVFFCGNLNEGGAQGVYNFDKTKFVSFFGDSTWDGKSITALGFSVADRY